MELNKWVREERGRASALARYMGTPQSFVAKLVSGQKQVPVHRAVQIEVFTGGQVTRQELRPHDFRLVWPDLDLAESAELTERIAEASEG